MSEALFPDNTVLCNFAAVNALWILRDVMRGRGRWTEAVALEARNSSRHLPALNTLLDEGWLGDPLTVVEEKEVLHVERVRRAVFGGRAEQPLTHLGEAQTCHVILSWPQFAGAWWVSDDREALKYARHQGITTRETFDVVAMSIADGDLTATEGHALLRQMQRLGRHLRASTTPGDLLR